MTSSIAAARRPDRDMQAYLVGGAVRDQLLGLPVRERDWVVVGASPQQMLELGFRQVGKDFPVFLHPDSHEEYALARTERKQGHGYHGFSCYAAPDVTLEQDLKRRDLTVNAMAMTPDGTLVDPYNGRADLEARVLRHVSEAFAEDPLRVLRTARFAARLHRFAFVVAPQTMTLMQAIVQSGELSYLATERIWVETARALTEQQASPYFTTLIECGAWQHLLGDLQAPAGEGGFACLDAVPEEIGLRFAGLAADCVHHNLAPCAARLSEAFHASKQASELAGLTEMLLQELAQPPADSEQWLRLLERCDALRRAERFEQALQVIEQDARQRQSTRATAAQRLRTAHTAAGEISAQTLLGRGLQGPALGEALREQRREAIGQRLSCA
jgi:tRNA nucleotidyltransferase (CCA-adding enzyme)